MYSQAELDSFSKLFESQKEIFRKTHDYTLLTIENDFDVITDVYLEEFLNNPIEKELFVKYALESQSTYEFRHNSEVWLLYALKKYGEKIYILTSLINKYAYKFTNTDRQKALPIYEKFKIKYGCSKYIEKLLNGGF